MKLDQDVLNSKNKVLAKYVPLIGYLVVFILVLSVNHYFPTAIIGLFCLNWISLLLLVLLMFGKPALIVISSGATKLKKIKHYFSRIILWQAFLMMSYSLNLILFYQLNFSENDFEKFTLDMQSLGSHYIQYGMFPLLLFPILIVGFSYRFFNERKSISISNIIRHIVPHRKVGIVSIGGHIYFRYIAMLSINITLAMLAIFTAKQILESSGISLVEHLSIQSMFVMSFLTMPLSVWPKGLLYLYERVRFGYALMILFVFLTISMMLLSATFHWLLPFITNKDLLTLFSFQLPAIRHAFPAGNELIYFSFCWWIGMGLPFCWLVARMSVGRSVREILLMTLIFPVGLFLLFQLPDMTGRFLALMEGLRHSTHLLLGFEMMMMFVLVLFFNGKRNLLGLCSRTQRAMSFNAFRTFASNTIVVTVLFLLLRFNVLYYFFMVIVVMGLIYLLFCSSAIVKQLYFKKVS